MNIDSTIPIREGTLSPPAEELDLSTFFPPTNSHSNITLTFDPDEPEGKHCPVSPVPVPRELPANTAAAVKSAGRALRYYNTANRSFVGIYAGRLCEITDGVIAPLDRGRLRILLTALSSWHKPGDESKTEIPLPFDLLESVLKASAKELDRLPEITGVHCGAMLKQNGEIVSAKGFEKETGWYFCRDLEIEEAPDIPSEDDLSRAREDIYSVYREFLFKDRADYENNLAALFSAMLRPSLPGPFPIHAVRKNSPRTGGSFLQQINGIAAFGAEMPVYPAPSRTEEMEKLHKTIVKESPLYAVIDNVPPGADFVSEFLLSATSGNGRASFRDFGTLNQVERAVTTQFCVNGNHLKISADVCGRVIATNIMAQKPWQDLRFSRKKDELIAYAQEMHPKIVRAFAVFLKNWIAKGRPAPPPCPGNLAEYPQWYSVIAGSLYAAGFSRVLSNLDEIQTEENEAETEGCELLSRLFAAFGSEVFTAAGLKTAMIREGEQRKEHQVSAQTILDYAPDRLVNAAVAGTLTDVMAGRWISQIADQKFAGYDRFLMKSRTPLGVRYKLVPVEKQTCLTDPQKDM
ncbi:hypothetical protein Mlab_0306 [Methanocorpusculum labreanum Z]|uniref:Uncharacterized protein n=1 Tax=Methanocorpusculum labreanum (strain ATCC 43576 / DSM 4855 / Z) TaxID=410358 RepID=A2SQ76_METLZ|nr:hypothetical protein [Methanocorpusculum labreanum]ABN06482.1 hypothetical protein Mlab_0306 [Methanocorpusculum labreanum Z]